MTLPDRATAPTRTITLDARNHLARALWASERHQNLVEYDVVQHAVACCTEPFGKLGRVSARPFDQIGKSRAAKLAQCGPDFDSTRAAREVGRLLVRDTVIVLCEVCAANGHRVPQSIRVAREH